jgi:hypothetical protein
VEEEEEEEVVEVVMRLLVVMLKEGLQMWLVVEGLHRGGLL